MADLFAGCFLMNLAELLSLERRFCPPSGRSKESIYRHVTAEGVHSSQVGYGPLARCGELLLAPLHHEIESARKSGPKVTNLRYKKFTGISEQAFSGKDGLLKRGWYTANRSSTAEEFWPKFRKLFYALLLGIDDATELVKVRKQAKAQDKNLAELAKHKRIDAENVKMWQVTERMGDYFFGTADDGGFFKYEVMFSSSPYRPEEAVYEILAAAECGSADSKGEIFLVSGGSRFAQADVGLLASATVAAAGNGMKCHFCVPSPSVVPTEASKSVDVFFKDVTDAITSGDADFFDHLWCLRPEDFSGEAAGHVIDTITPKAEMKKKIGRNLLRVDLPLYVTEEVVRRSKTWPGQFLNPAFRYVYVSHPTDSHRSRLFVSREASGTDSREWHPVNEPFAFRASASEQKAFENWCNKVCRGKGAKISSLADTM